jgi:cytochrome bd-type quinol oxidase subunit 2
MISPAPAPAAGRPVEYRLVTAVLLLGSGAAHLPVMQEHLREAAWMGCLFAAFAVACAALAAALALSGSRVPQLAAGTLCVLAVLTYAATRVVAFPQLHDDVGNWGEPWGVVSITLETLGAVAAFRPAFRTAFGAARE